MDIEERGTTMNEGLNRRSFLKGALVSGVSLAAASFVGCSPNDGNQSTKQPTSEETGFIGDFLAKDFENSSVAIDPITDISEEKTYDIVVVGAGTSGLPAVLTALEEGASVACLQKESKAISQGSGAGGLLIDESTPFGIHRFMQKYRELCEYRVNDELLSTYAYHSGEAIMWMAKMANEAGYPNAKNSKSVFEYEENSHVTKIMNDAAIKPESNQNLFEALSAYAESKGAEFFYNTPGIQLATEGNRVTAVIGKSGSDYIKFNAAKAVILATGDYQNNDSIVERFSPDISRFSRKQSNKTGDGILMSALIGGHMCPVGHSRQMHDFDSGPMHEEPFLAVNENGERFMNEEIPSTSAANVLRFQKADDPGKYSMIFDSNYEEQVASWGGRPASLENLKKYVPGEVSDASGIIESLIDTHYADTLDELAEKLGIPADNLKKSVDRYNKMVAQGFDEDFGKLPKYLKPIDTPPYWGRHRWIRITATCCGVAVNGNYQVLNQDNEPFDGLYAVGFGAGDLCGGADWSIYWTGMSCGSCMTSGRVAASHALTGILEPSHPITWDAMKDIYAGS